MYIWEYQDYFQVFINRPAIEIFNELRAHLNPKVWVIGVWDEENERDNPYPVDVITIDTPFESKLFSEINDKANNIYDNFLDGQLLYSDERADKELHYKLKTNAKFTAMREVLEEASKELNVSFYTASPIKKNGFLVFTILQLNKEVVKSIPTLNNALVLDRYIVKRSLLESTISEFLTACSNALQIPNIGERPNVLGRNANEFIRSSGDAFLNTLLSSRFHGPLNLFEIFNLISSRYYEGGESKGRIIISNKNHSSINQILEFSAPINLSNHKAVRKLLEMTSENISLLTNGIEVYGMGNLINNDSIDEDLFIIDFIRHFTWELTYNDSILMVVEYGQPRLPRKRMEKKLFTDHLIRIFSNIGGSDINVIWSTILAAMEQKHGTMVVITDKAAEEANRLKGQCINIEPINLTTETIRLVTSIDGAVLLDPNGKCHALGVILDGRATEKGDPARGARYNSALRYLDTQENECLIVVVSEDGDINLVPHLKPQISRQLIDTLINDLQQVNKSEQLDIKIFNNIMQNLEGLEFYLLPKDCNEVNELRKVIESKMDSKANRIVYRDFSPSPEMNSSYYKK